jgi:DNA-binding response OmpR family regulator
MSFSDNPFDANERGECSILVVDDNHEVLEALRRVLEAHHYRVQCATTAGEAQRLLLKNPPNLILSDLLMPDKDGFSFYEHVRKSTVLHDIPFIILTGAESPELRLQAHREGCDDYLLKPIDPDELLAVVEGKLQRARQLKEVSARRMQVLHRRIIHTLSHEFRTPLVSIQAGAELLSERIDAEGDPTAKLVLDAIHEGGKRLQRLVEDFMLLTAARSWSGTGNAFLAESSGDRIGTHDRGDRRELRRSTAARSHYRAGGENVGSWEKSKSMMSMSCANISPMYCCGYLRMR